MATKEGGRASDAVGGRPPDATGGRTRRRLSSEERREQLLAVGARLFAEQPYDDVWIERVAELAGVSRGLLYHYFPAKRDFFTAVVERESERMLRLTAPLPGLPVRRQLETRLDAFLAYAERNAHGFRAFQRAEAAGDGAVREIHARALAAQERQILEALADDAEFARPPREQALLRAAVRGWLAFTHAVCLDWLADGDLTREQVRDLCARALLGAVAG